MKIASQTEATLVLEDKGIAAFVAGGFFALIGVGVTIFLYTQKSASSAPPLIGLIGIAIGVIVIALQRSIRIEIDKTQGTISVKTKRLIGGSSQQNRAISDVVKVQMVETLNQREVTDSSSSTNSGLRNTHTETYLDDQVLLLFNDGGTQTIGSSSRQVGGLRGTLGVVSNIGTNYAMQIGTTVATFLGVPFEQTAPTGNMIAGGIQQALQQAVHPTAPGQPVSPVTPPPIVAPTPQSPPFTESNPALTPPPKPPTQNPPTAPPAP